MIVEASDIGSLFQAALAGLNQVIKKDFCAGQQNNLGADQQICQDVQVISVQAEDQTLLLIDFLSAVLTLSHLNRCIYCRADFSELTDMSLTARIFGASAERFDSDVKAVTYHEADIRINEKGNYQTVIVLDI
jgi:hypothetical protein